MAAHSEEDEELGEFDTDNVFENEKHNEFESFEIEIPEDISIEDLEKADILQLPFETAIQQFVEQEEPTTKPPLVCKNCGKAYKREVYYVKHLSICGKNNL